MPDLIAIFCEIDDFCKDLIQQRNQVQLDNGAAEAKTKTTSRKKKRNRKFTMTMSEVVKI